MAASNFHLLYSANPNLRHLATLNYKSSLAGGQKGGIIAPQRFDPFSPPFQHPESDLRLRYPNIAFQLGSGKRGDMSSVQVHPVGKRWNRAPRQFGRGAQRGGIAAGALGKMVLKPALGVAVPMLAKLGINQIGKLVKKKKKRQRGGNIRALAGQLVESPQFTRLLTDPLMHVTGMARRYGTKGIKSLQTKLARELRGGSSQKGGSIKQRLTGEGKIIAGDLIRNAASLLGQDATRNFVKSTVRKKVPFFKDTASRKAWGAVNSALRKASREGTKMAASGRKQSGGAFGIAAMLGKALLPTVAGAILEPALGGILKQVGLGKKRRVGRRATAMNKMFRAAMQRGGRGNSSSSSTNAVIKQALQPASTTVAPAKKTKKKKSKSDILWSVVNSNVAGKFANTFGQKASDAVLAKIFG